MPCKTKAEQIEYQRLWMAKRRSEYFAGKSCSRCGSTLGLVIHHIDPKNKRNHRVWSWREERRKEELGKCVVLCLACHKLEHGVGENYHGTMYGYNHKLCRCALCREARRQYGVKQRKKKAAQGRSSFLVEVSSDPLE